MRFQIRFHFISWWCLSLGLHVDVRYPCVQIHVPGGFFTIGRFWFGSPRARIWGPFALSSAGIRGVEDEFPTMRFWHRWRR